MFRQEPLQICFKSVEVECLNSSSFYKCIYMNTKREYDYINILMKHCRIDDQQKDFTML